MPFILEFSSPEDNKTKEKGYNLPGTESKRINSILFLLETLENLGFQGEYNRINVITKIPLNYTQNSETISKPDQCFLDYDKVKSKLHKEVN